MSDSRTPFNHRPDPDLGAALRRALEPADQAAFVARVLAAAARPLAGAAGGARSPVDVLAGWARPGIAAAAVAALVAGYALGRELATRTEESLDEAMVTALAPSASAAALAASAGPPDGSVVFATFVEP
jgi:hypothetical protein